MKRYQQKIICTTTVKQNNGEKFTAFGSLNENMCVGCSHSFHVFFSLAIYACKSWPVHGKIVGKYYTRMECFVVFNGKIV